VTIGKHLGDQPFVLQHHPFQTSAMRLKSVLLSLVAATTVIAMPTPDDHDTIPELQGWKPWSCLTDYQAVAIVNIFIQSEQTNGNETTTYDSLIESIANSDD
jgi:hypothetical protein